MKQHTRTNLMLIAILTFVLAVGALLATSIVLKPDATADSPASDVILSQDFNGDGIPEGWEDLIGSVEDGMGLINSGFQNVPFPENLLSESNLSLIHI